MKSSKINAKGILSRIKNKPPKSQKVSFSLESSLYEQFRRVCQKEDVAMSNVLEELMKDFLVSQGIKIEEL